MLNNKLLSRFIAAAIATIMGLSSGLTLSSLYESKTNASNSKSQHFAYMLDQDGKNETRIMMDGNNLLKNGYYMNAQLSLVDSSKTGMEALFNVKLSFKIPGYDSNNLKFFVFDKNPQHSNQITEYQLSSGPLDPIPSIYISDLKSSSYNVHVYNGSLAQENFVAKAEFTLWPNSVTMESATDFNILNSAGAPVQGADGSNLSLKVITPSTTLTDQFQFALPIEIVPYYARTIKVVFFAKDRPEGGSPNIDRTLYDYFYSGTISSSDTNVYLEYAVDAGWGNNEVYEAHFYVDEVLPENFLCKVENISEPSS